jgi:carboxypeptidase D
MNQGAPCQLRSDENFTSGIVNGAAWYAVEGGMQDWNYVRADCFELTIEMGCNKFPPASEFPKFWEENREPLLSYIEQVRCSTKRLLYNIFHRFLIYIE